MKIMVVGGGGREHAIIKKILEDNRDVDVFCLPGNGGIEYDAKCVDIKATDIEGIVNFAKENAIDYAIVAQDDPLALGAVDELAKIGVKSFGPDKKAAEIESSKVFSKNLMKKYGIPTARYEVFDDMKKALDYIDTAQMPIVIKADGLALGKGVTIAKTKEEAAGAVKTLMEEKKFGASGERVVIEEYLEGPEVTVLSFADGKTVVPMLSSMDHKRAYDGDEGPNTGGMGCIAPNPFYTPEIAKECMEKIFIPTINAMNAEGRPFKGCLYFGLMLTKDGPKVIEYNSRFGDPEAQVVLPLLESNLLTVMKACTEGTLAECEVKLKKKMCTCCVIMASKGYPGAYEKNAPVKIPADVMAYTYVAGAKRPDDLTDAIKFTADTDDVTPSEFCLLTDGGRVLGVTGMGLTLKDAVDTAYGRVKRVDCANLYYRNDIGARALAELSRQEKML